MPKLKKLSKIKNDSESEQSKIKQPQNSLNQIQNSSDQNTDIASDKQQNKKNNRNKKQKKKSQKRSVSKKKLKQQALKQADEILKNMTQQFADNQNQNSNESGYIPLQLTKQNKKRKSKNKQQKNNIKIKNKYFNDMLVSNTNFQSYQPQIQLDVKKKQINKDQKIQKIMNKFALKADKIKNRLSYKDKHQDTRYKQHLKKTISDAKNCRQDDNINIILQMPKIFSGPNTKEANAALFIKNSQNSHTSILQQQQNKVEDKRQSNDKKKQINRQTFYSQFRKQINNKKILQLQKKDYFKTSSLEDFSKQFENHQHLFQQNSNSNVENSRLSRENSKFTNKSNQKLTQNSNSLSQSRKSFQKIIQAKKEIIIPTPVKQVLQTSNSIQKKLKITKQKKQRNKISKQKLQKKMILKNLTSKYIQQQAQDSDISGSINGQQSDQDDDTDISSLIDNSYCENHNSKDQANVLKLINQQQRQKHKKMMQSIQQKFNVTRKHKIIGQDSHQRKRKKRIKEAQEKFFQQDGNNDNQLIKQKQKQRINEENVDEGNKQQFEAQLKKIQGQIDVRKRQRSCKKNSIQKKSKPDTNIWKSIKLNQRKPVTTKRGGFFNNTKSITGTKIQTQISKLKKRQSKQIKFQDKQ